MSGTWTVALFALLGFVESHHDAGTAVGIHSVPVSQVLGQNLRPSHPGGRFGDLPEV
jgi:hypothetical protein